MSALPWTSFTFTSICWTIWSVPTVTFATASAEKNSSGSGKTSRVSKMLAPGPPYSIEVLIVALPDAWSILDESSSCARHGRLISMSEATTVITPRSMTHRIFRLVGFGFMLGRSSRYVRTRLRIEPQGASPGLVRENIFSKKPGASARRLTNAIPDSMLVRSSLLIH